jgi:O-antigen/teichoic acid export membrane protein
MAILAALGQQLATLSLGEAAIYEISRGRLDVRQALKAVSALAYPLTAAVSVALAAVVVATLEDTSATEVGLAALLVPAGASQLLMTGLLNARERFSDTSFALGISSVVTTIGTLLFVAALGLGVAGALLALVLGPTAGSVLLAVQLHRLNLLALPTWNTPLIQRLVKFGASMQGSALFITIASRVDTLMVYWLANAAAAGNYSVALTLAGLAGIAPVSLSQVMFPRIAAVNAAAARSLIAKQCRVTALLATTVALVVGVVALFGLTLIFGEAFAPAVAPTLWLLPSAIVANLQWALGRASAARGQPTVLLVSYGVNAVTMLLLDVILIPALGISGAAIASTVGAVAGLVVAWQGGVGSQMSVADLVPMKQDLRDVLLLVRVRMPGSTDVPG